MNRTWLPYRSLVAGTAVSLSFMPGCANPPTSAEIEARYQTDAASIEREHQRMVAVCRQQFPSDQNAETACTQAANEWRQNQLTLALRARNQAYATIWTDARGTTK